MKYPCLEFWLANLTFLLFLFFQELYDNLEKQRPSLFRLASDTDEKDNEGMTEILAVNDSVVKTMSLYKRLVEGEVENGLLSLQGPNDSKLFTRTLNHYLCYLGFGVCKF